MEPTKLRNIGKVRERKNFRKRRLRFDPYQKNIKVANLFRV